ncbi:hypothetical protein [Hymenobacter elongatus]|uniref:STAS/SEC14 domain-containing protein n=1 Tax=Hymenobacter elongatus TaxID=877208 RepID=A0A4Z0PJ72_9BACT|nr:hypothetical protein [Hymenobacter elongatus]TGE14380.1 hypothetical protein E5J99_16155 [Hymenobacter elongatus]
MANLLYPSNASLYFHNELATVIEHADGYARIDWNPVPISSSSLRAVYEHVLRLLRSRGFSKVLSDHLLMPPIQPDDQQWLIQDWAPRAVREAGYRHCAIIQAYAAANRLATTRVVQQLEPTMLTVRYFDDNRAAEQWLCCA